eukprot:gb/GECG01008620.1/.p1 GENE.gb/GECG01008620.1/~~gb/GECG01008620.1/.p1  ORF type:complete len:964 (+),score=116.76 gb/GECG01008620.1/:1-2892(+)
METWKLTLKRPEESARMSIPIQRSRSLKRRSRLMTPSYSLDSEWDGSGSGNNNSPGETDSPGSQAPLSMSSLPEEIRKDSQATFSSPTACGTESNGPTKTVATSLSSVDLRVQPKQITPVESYKQRMSAPVTSDDYKDYNSKEQEPVKDSESMPLFLSVLNDVASRSRYTNLAPSLDRILENATDSDESKEKELYTKIQDIFHLILDGYRGSNTLVTIDHWLPFAPVGTQCLDLQDTNFCGQEKYLKALKDHEKHLKCLLLKGAPLSCWNSLDDLLPMGGSLECLSLRHCDIEDKMFEITQGALAHVKILDLIGCSLITPRIILALGKLPSLECVGLDPQVSEFWNEKQESFGCLGIDLERSKTEITSKNTRKTLDAAVRSLGMRGPFRNKGEVASQLFRAYSEYQEASEFLERVRTISSSSEMNKKIGEYRTSAQQNPIETLARASDSDMSACSTMKSLADYSVFSLSGSVVTELDIAHLEKERSVHVSPTAQSPSTRETGHDTSCKNPGDLKNTEGKNKSGSHNYEKSFQEGDSQDSEAETVRQEVDSPRETGDKTHYTGSAEIDEELKALASSQSRGQSDRIPQDTASSLRELRSETSVSSVSRRLKFEEEGADNSHSSGGGTHAQRSSTSSEDTQPQDDQGRIYKQTSASFTGKQSQQKPFPKARDRHRSGYRQYSRQTNNLASSTATHNPGPDPLALAYGISEGKHRGPSDYRRGQKEQGLFSPPPSASSMKSLKRHQYQRRSLTSPDTKTSLSKYAAFDGVKNDYSGISTPPQQKHPRVPNSTYTGRSSSLDSANHQQYVTPRKRKRNDGDAGETEYHYHLEDNWQREINATDSTGRVWRIKAEKASLLRQLRMLKQTSNNHSAFSPLSLKSSTATKAERTPAESSTVGKCKKPGFKDVLKFRYETLRPALIELRPQILASEELPLRELYDELYHVYYSAKKQLKALGELNKETKAT